MQSLLIKEDERDYKKNLCGINRIGIIKFQSWIMQDKNYKRFFQPKFNLTKTFLSDLKYRSKGENHFIIEVIGETGSGKSIATIVIALKIKGYENFKNEHIQFERKDLINRVKKNFKMNDIFILDEQTVGVGVGSEREKLEQQNLEEISRKAGLNMIFNSPTVRTHGTSHYRLLYVRKDKKERISFFGLLRNMGDMTYLPIGYVGIKIPEEKEEFGKFWKKYNERKDKFIEKIMKQKELQRLDYKEMASKILEHKLYKKGLKHKHLLFIAQDLFPFKTKDELQFVVSAFELMYPKEREMPKKFTEKKAKSQKKVDADAIRRMKAEGMTNIKIAKLLGINRTTVYEYTAGTKADI